MIRRASLRALFPILLLVGADPSAVGAQETSSPLADFGELVVGTWEADGSRHVIEWGVGRLAVRTRSFFADGESWTLVSEGMWWWDDAAETIRGLAVAVGMPVERFEYVTRVEGRRVIHELTAYGEMSGEMFESWLVDADGYAWTLSERRDGTLQEIMGGAYRRIR